MDQSSLTPRRRLESASTDSSTRKGYSSLKYASDSVDLDDLQQGAARSISRTSTRSHFGTVGKLTGYLSILCPLLTAALVASMNYVAFSQLDGNSTGSHDSQFWITVLKNALPTAVALLLLVALKSCLSQVALYRIRLGVHSLSLVSLLASPPSVLTILSILFKSSMRISLMWFVLLAIISQTITLTSIFIPGTLTVTQSSQLSTQLQIPTIDFNAVDPTVSSFITVGGDDPPTLGFVEPSQRWRQLISRAASSSIAPTWDPPAGCGSSCNYTFVYIAPALNCTDLTRKDIWPSGTNTTDSRLAFPLNSTDPNTIMNAWFFYNSSFDFTYANSTDQPVSILDVIYMDNFNTTSDVISNLTSQYPDPTQWNPLGVHCEYQNATYEATTAFSNNSQLTTTRITEFNGFLPIGHDADGPYSGTNTTNISLAFYSIAQAFSELINGNASYQADDSSLATAGTLALNTPLFNLTGAIQNITSQEMINTIVDVNIFSLSSSLRGNLSTGIQDLLGNTTLAFVNEGTANTLATVSVTPNSTQYQFHAIKMALIYAIVFSGALVVVIYGIWCLEKNGTTAVFDLAHIVEMTVGSRGLHESADDPQFGSIPVKGIFLSDGTLTRTALDIYQ